MKVEIARERCQGAGLCALNAPELFDQDDEDGLIIVLGDGERVVEGVAADEEPARAAQRAADLCPNAVIRLVRQ